jgi:hypothetical protein
VPVLPPQAASPNAMQTIRRPTHSGTSRCRLAVRKVEGESILVLRRIFISFLLI